MDFIREAGFGIWLVLLFGGVSFAASLRYALAPRRELLPLIVGFAIATLLAGALGTVTGIQLSAEHIGEVEASKRWIFLLGLRESLNNAVAALVLASVDALLATAGAYRLFKAERSGAEAASASA